MQIPLPLSIPNSVAEKLGYYVYLYVDPRDGKPFYVGKGQGQRVLAHLYEEGETRKLQVLKELALQGLQPHIDILAHALKDEETALRIEAAVIDLFGLDGLTNAVRGWKSVQLGRLSLPELVTYYNAPVGVIVDPVLLIRINQMYRHKMSAVELYEVTRGVWKLGPRRHNAKYAFAVFEGVVREVYEIHSWHPAGTNPYETRTKEDVGYHDRWEFIGAIAPAEVRNKYFGHSITAYLTKGSQNPIAYVNA